MIFSGSGSCTESNMCLICVWVSNQCAHIQGIWLHFGVEVVVSCWRFKTEESFPSLQADVMCLTGFCSTVSQKLHFYTTKLHFILKETKTVLKQVCVLTCDVVGKVWWSHKVHIKRLEQQQHRKDMGFTSCVGSLDFSFVFTSCVIGVYENTMFWVKYNRFSAGVTLLQCFFSAPSNMGSVKYSDSKTNGKHLLIRNIFVIIHKLEYNLLLCRNLHFQETGFVFCHKLL